MDVNISNDSLNIEGYKISFRKDCNFYGGGVMIYIFDFIVVFWKYDLEFNGIEILWIEILYVIENFFLCCVYCLLNFSSIFW